MCVKPLGCPRMEGAGQGEAAGCKPSSAPGLGVFKGSRASLLQVNICGTGTSPVLSEPGL